MLCIQRYHSDIILCVLLQFQRDANNKYTYNIYSKYAVRIFLALQITPSRSEVRTSHRMIDTLKNVWTKNIRKSIGPFI